MFLFLREIDATNWRAEQAIRPAVVIRKVCGGNRTRKGADTQPLDRGAPSVSAASMPMLTAEKPAIPEAFGPRRRPRRRV